MQIPFARSSRALSPCGILLLMIFSVVPGQAQESGNWALGASAGTLGVGVELTAGLSPQINARFGLQGFQYSEEREADDIEYDAEAKLRSVKALLDWHPGGGGFRLTGGLLYNATTVEGSSLPPASGFYEIGSIDVPVQLLGTLDAEVELDPVVPYAGLGWGNPLRTGGRFGVGVDLGVVFQGEPEVTLRPVFAPGSPIPDIPGAAQLLGIALAQEERNIEEDIQDYDLYPVLGLTLWYRF